MVGGICGLIGAFLYENAVAAPIGIIGFIISLVCALLGAAFSLSRVLGFSYDAMDSYGLIMRSAGTLAAALLAFLSLAAMSACARASRPSARQAIACQQGSSGRFMSVK